MHEEFTELLQLLNFVRQTSGHAHKALCQFAEVPPMLIEQIKLLIAIDTSGFQFSADSYGLRHALTGHSQELGSRDHHPLLEADVLALPFWVVVSPILKSVNPAKSP